MTDLNLALVPQAVIAGKVIDEDGDPVNEVNVQALRQTWSRGKQRYLPHGGGLVNDLGEFRVGNLPAGQYFVFAQKFEMGMPGNELPAMPGKPDVRQVRTFFPDATNMESAAPVTVTAGQIASGMDIHLQKVPTFHVRGKIAGYIGHFNAESLMLNVIPRQQGSMMMFGSHSNVNKDLTFDLPGIAPGSYSLNIVTVQTGFGQGVARQSIDVSAADLNDVVLTIVPPGTLHGHIRLEGTPTPGSAQSNLAQTHIYLSPVEEGAMGWANAMAASDGAFSLENVVAGRYYPQISDEPDGAYLKSVRWGQQEMLGKNLDFSSGVAGELEIVFSYGAAELGGSVQLPQPDQPAAQTASQPQPVSPPDFSVVLVPDVLTKRLGVKSAKLDQNGAFSLKQLTPGHYRAYAFEHIELGALQNPDVLKQLESKGVEVELKENDKKQVPLTPIPANDMRELFGRLGIALDQ